MLVKDTIIFFHVTLMEWNFVFFVHILYNYSTRHLFYSLPQTLSIILYAINFSSIMINSINRFDHQIWWLISHFYTIFMFVPRGNQCIEIPNSRMQTWAWELPRNVQGTYTHCVMLCTALFAVLCGSDSPLHLDLYTSSFSSFLFSLSYSLSWPVLSCPVLSYSYPTLPCPVLSYIDLLLPYSYPAVPCTTFNFTSYIKSSFILFHFILFYFVFIRSSRWYSIERELQSSSRVRKTHTPLYTHTFIYTHTHTHDTLIHTHIHLHIHNHTHTHLPLSLSFFIS